MDCGADDANETCLAEGCYRCVEDPPCPVHRNGPCPEPGSRRFDPYSRGPA